MKTQEQTKPRVSKGAEPYEARNRRNLTIAEEEFNLTSVVHPNGSGYYFDHDELPSGRLITWVHATAAHGRSQHPMEVVDEFIERYLKERFGDKYTSHELRIAKFIPNQDSEKGRIEPGKVQLEGIVRYFPE